MRFAANRDLPPSGFRTWSARGIWANAQMFHEIGRSGVAKIALVIGVRFIDLSSTNHVARQRQDPLETF